MRFVAIAVLIACCPCVLLGEEAVEEAGNPAMSLAPPMTRPADPASGALALPEQMPLPVPPSPPVDKTQELLLAAGLLRQAGFSEDAAKYQQIAEQRAKAQALIEAGKHLDAAGYPEDAARYRKQAETVEKPPFPPQQVQPVPPFARRPFPFQERPRPDRPERPATQASQIVLHVKAVEVSAAKLSKLGMKFEHVVPERSSISRGSAAASPPGRTSLDILNAAGAAGLVEALCKDNLAKVLADPTLVTVSGRPVSFRSGGEIPVPSDKGGLGWRKYGTELELRPQILPSGAIRLDCRATFSELDLKWQTVIRGVAVPGVATRTCDTAVEFRPGEGFLLRGPIGRRPSEALPEATATSPGVVTPGPVVPSVPKAEDDETELWLLISADVVDALDVPPPRRNPS